MLKLLLLTLALVSTCLALAPLFLSQREAIADNYIVVFRDDITAETLDADLEAIRVLHNLTYHFTYKSAIKGFASILTAPQLASLRLHPRIDFIEEDQIMRASCTPPATGSDWGLSRISSTAPLLDGRYSFPDSGGTGVTAYVIDTGVLVSHTDFGGRATFGFSANASWSRSDGNGHGTHVSSTVGGLRYGVAKGVYIVGVKVLSDQGSGSNAGVIAGIDWVRGNHVRPSVSNLSLGGGYSAATNNAVNALSASGNIVAVAAGNDNADACNYSPASATQVLSTGATARTDTRSTFSNYGTCTQIFAPGTNILGAWIGGNTASRTISGTSMASPHVCGVAALIVADEPGLSFAQVRTRITSTASADYLNLGCANAACRASPNRLLFNGCDRSA